MLFNSIEFGIFLPLVFLIYWGIGPERLRLQNGFLLAASYFFYGWWDWRFLSLIIISSAVDYLVGLGLNNVRGRTVRKCFLFSSLSVNLGLLGFFKYFNFFTENFSRAFQFFGQDINPGSLNIILPVGISFYTFQTLSYTIDIYRKKIPPTRDALAFFTYVSFFPQLVAGPIERASNLIPQFLSRRKFSYETGRDGLRQILWGLFKKIVVADTCAILVNDIFENYDKYPSSVLVLGAVYFAFQIYGDFSGYSDIAIGTARLFGFNLMRNFAFPYFSRDIAEFWRRWHISLSTWFRDYVYIPMGGNQGTAVRRIINVMTIFLLSGFWHGADWTFIAWGGLNALYFLPLMLRKKNRRHTGVTSEGKFLPGLMDTVSMLMTFSLVVFAWIFFRAENLGHAYNYMAGIFSFDLFPLYTVKYKFVPLVAFLIIWEWFSRHKQHGLEIDNLPISVRWPVYLMFIWLILLFAGEEQQFIYFQF